MSRREFLMLAQTFDPDRHDVRGWFWSIKYDGQRCLWDGGVSRGKLKANIPWANTQKDARYREQQIATGLWSRYGHVIHAPDWWLDTMPVGMVLDGELWEDRGLFQHTRSVVGTQDGSSDWSAIKFLVIDAPSPELVFAGGVINNPNWKNFTLDGPLCRSMFGGVHQRVVAFGQFVDEYSVVKSGTVVPIVQSRLPDTREGAMSSLMDALEAEVKLGGEGLMLRSPSSYWEPKRLNKLLKVKPALDAEATVVGWEEGKGKLSGLMGALVCVSGEGKMFKLSGFTDEERLLKESPESWPALFPVGCTITYRYMGLTDDGFPREPRYFRK